MKKYKMLIVFYILAISCSAQNLAFNYSVQSEKFIGNIKSITCYILDLESADTTQIDTIIRKAGKIASIKKFDRSGLLTNAVNFSTNTWEKNYYYNEEQNLASIITKNIETREVKKEIFDYDYKNNIITDSFSIPSQISINGKIKFYLKKRLMFDHSNRLIQTEYLDKNGESMMTSQSNFDSTSNRKDFRLFQEGVLTNGHFQEFDKKGRCTMQQSIDANGIYTDKSIYTWVNDNTLIYELFHVNGAIEMKYKEVFIKDKVGNIVKKYYFNEMENHNTLTEYVIEYY